MNRIRQATLATTLVLALGCHNEERRAEPPPPAMPAPAQAQPAPAAPAQVPAASAEEKTEAPGCAVPVHGGPAEQVSIGTHKATRTGTTLAFDAPAADQPLTLGVLGPINEDSGENLVGLKRYEQFFEKNHVDAIVVTGDVGEVAHGITVVLDELAQTRLPVLVVIGNRECLGDFSEGVRAAQARFSNVVNLNETREVSFPGATLLSLPGYHDPNFINCDTGCRYTQKNLDELVTMAQGARRPVVLVSHGPPRGEGSQALDYAESAGNVGDPALAKTVEQGHIGFGMFSNIKEAGGRATDLAGTTTVPQDHFVPSLYLNPGPAGVEGWRMNGGTTGHGFAAILTLKGGQGSWKLYEGKKLTPAEKQQAKKLAAQKEASQENP
jgi:Icc-related predicted phosphoesterase